MPDERAIAPSSRAGLLFALTAYAWWGVLPLYIALAAPATPAEIIGWRVLFSSAFCALVLFAVRGGWRRVAALVRDGRVVGTLLVAGLLVAGNWLLYVYAVASGHAVEGALGYFLNPLVSIVLALVVLRERLRPLQWAAVGVALVAVVVLATGYGEFPWIAIGLACTFGVYGLVKKRVGARVDALGGLFVESALIAPIGLGMLWWAATAGGGITFAALGPLHTTVLSLAGAVTAVPLLLFAAATRRLTLVQVGMVQFVAPMLQFVIGVFVFHEHMPPERWAGFAIVWVALACFVADLVRAGRAGRGAARD